MKDKELRKLIGSRAKQRRQELGLKQPYVAEKMGVTASTIQRYEAGTIDNTKKLVLDGLKNSLGGVQVLTEVCSECALETILNIPVLVQLFFLLH